MFLLVDTITLDIKGWNDIRDLVEHLYETYKQESQSSGRSRTTTSFQGWLFNTLHGDLTGARQVHFLDVDSGKTSVFVSGRALVEVANDLGLK